MNSEEATIKSPTSKSVERECEIWNLSLTFNAADVDVQTVHVASWRGLGPARGSN